ncbi:Os06g0180400 [Oryza sativa Japonica Group]|uniref:Os06g0180400 protein n=1 Tax=Oryza sativa subsp. japonica TaxID=39947 RepID=A0A0P0WTB2_ORYSJ|nr:Os06g0180400 [Oryza sativa Japonica Group]
MASSLLVAFLLLSSYAVLSVCSSRPIAGGVEVIWSTGAATTTMEADGGQSHCRRGGGTSVVVRYLVARRTVMGMEVPSRESTMMRRLPDREPVRRPRMPPSPMPNKPVSSGMPPCLGDGCGRIRG